MPARRTNRGWRRSLSIAIAIHLALAVVVWLVAARLWSTPVSIDHAPSGGSPDASATGLQTSRLPPILRVEQSIHSAPLQSLLLFNQDADADVEWTTRRQFIDESFAIDPPFVGSGPQSVDDRIPLRNKP